MPENLENLIAREKMREESEKEQASAYFSVCQSEKENEIANLERELDFATERANLSEETNEMFSQLFSELRAMLRAIEINGEIKILLRGDAFNSQNSKHLIETRKKLLLRLFGKNSAEEKIIGD